MNFVFYLAAAIAVVSTFMVVTRLNAVHSLLYLIVSLIAVSLVFFVLGAPFIAALEIIIYAGAIMVLFIFVVMMLNLGPQTVLQERQWLAPSIWVGPAIMSMCLLGMVLYALRSDASWLHGDRVIEPKEVSLALFGPYVIIVELASMLLLSGLVGAYRLGRRDPVVREARR